MQVHEARIICLQHDHAMFWFKWLWNKVNAHKRICVQAPTNDACWCTHVQLQDRYAFWFTIIYAYVHNMRICARIVQSSMYLLLLCKLALDSLLLMRASICGLACMHNHPRRLCRRLLLHSLLCRNILQLHRCSSGTLSGEVYWYLSISALAQLLLGRYRDAVARARVKFAETLHAVTPGVKLWTSMRAAVKVKESGVSHLACWMGASSTIRDYTCMHSWTIPSSFKNLPSSTICISFLGYESPFTI